MAARSPYVEQLRESARLIAQQLNHSHWFIAYQSRSGKPTDSWLEPDVGDLIRDLGSQGESDVIIAPLGFVCDHVEVLYDLDIEAKRMAESSGVGFVRAACPNDHPTFIEMLADVIQDTMKNAED
jgi:ferrochelatase